MRVDGEDAPQALGDGRRQPKRSHLVAILAGVAVGAGAIAAAVVLLVRSGGGEAAPPPPARTVAESVLKIIFPEGFTRRAMAERIRAVNRIAKDTRDVTPILSPAEYLYETRRSKLPATFGATKKSTTLEGFLFPATYDFTPRTTSRQLVDLQLAAFRKAWRKVDLTYAKKHDLTPYDVLTIASMIEGEVRVPRERKLVSAVIYNRLRRGMPLGIDATIRYGLDIPPTQSLTDRELKSPNPYNTRIHKGLPPTPIDNPGLASIQAAAHPAHVDYLYFVRRKDCKTHFFTKSANAFYAFLQGPRC